MRPRTNDTRQKRWPLCDGVTLRYPVVQAPLGPCDNPRLAAAVSRAGGLGCLSLFDETADAAYRRVEQVRIRTARPFLTAFVNQWEPEAVLDACIAAGARLFQVFWWNGPRLSSRIRAAGGTVFWQVGMLEQAREAIEIGADVLVAQGTEAGGQVRGPVPLAKLLPTLREETDLPLIGGGGLATREDVAMVLALGARAAMLGTRFVAAEEASAPVAYKTRVVRSTLDDIYLDRRVMGSWPCAPLRRIRTARAGLPDEPYYFAGLGIERIDDILPAGEIVRRLAP